MAVLGTEPVLNIHSGPDYYDCRMWKAVILEEENAVRFTLNSPDGDQGFPGNLTLHVTYILTEDNTVKLVYDAVSDAKTFQTAKTVLPMQKAMVSVLKLSIMWMPLM